MARVDRELVERGLAPSRTQAQRLLEEGRVALNGARVERASTSVETRDDLQVSSDGDDYVSRAAHKLAGALDAWALTPLTGPVVEGRRVLDAGASTGGFTEVVLRRGAEHVVAVDVGHDQLDPRIRARSEVSVVENTNVRYLDPATVAPAAELLVADLSFISLRLVLAPLAACLAPGADAVVLVKPQFEVGRERLGSGGVVSDPLAQVDAVVGVLEAAHDAGFRALSVLPSSLPGTHGNRELVAWLRLETIEDEGRAPASRESEHARLAREAVDGRMAVAEWSTW